MKEKIFCFAQYKIFHLVTSKRSAWDLSCREGEGADVFSCGTPYLQGSSIPRQGGCQFFLLAQFRFLCLYLDFFLLRVRYSTFGTSVLPSSQSHQDTCPLATPSDYMVWQHPMQKAVSAERHARAPAWKHNWVRDVPGTGMVLPSQADMNLSSIQLIRMSWLLTKRGTRSSPSI